MVLALSKKGYTAVKMKGNKKFSRIMKLRKGKFVIFVADVTDRAYHSFSISCDGLYPIIFDSYNDHPLYLDRHNLMYSCWEFPQLLRHVFEIKKNK